MTEVSRIGLGLAKSVFHVHGVDAREEVTVRRPLRRSQMLSWFGKLPPCLIGNPSLWHGALLGARAHPVRATRFA